jgi:hypothetical protein
MSLRSSLANPQQLSDKTFSAGQTACPAPLGAAGEYGCKFPT